MSKLTKKAIRSGKHRKASLLKMAIKWKGIFNFVHEKFLPLTNISFLSIYFDLGQVYFLVIEEITSISESNATIKFQ